MANIKSSFRIAVQSTQVIADPWVTAFEQSKQKLAPKDLNRVLQINNFEQLQSAIDNLKSRHNAKSLTKSLRVLDPFLQNLKSFGGAIDVITSAHPEIAALCWGGVKVVLEVSLRFNGAIERISEVLAGISNILPRLESYQHHLPSTPSFNKALIRVYQGVVEFCFEAIDFFRKHPLRNLIRSFWSNNDQLFTQKNAIIERASQDVDLEASAAKIILDETRHDYVINMLKTSPMIRPPGKLPLHSIPFNKNAGFFGRRGEMETCRSILSSAHQQKTPKFLVLYGTGGVGKTSVSLNFAHEEKAHRQIILWIGGDDVTKMERCFIEIAGKIGIPATASDSKRARDDVIQWLEESNEKWLIVFDNVERPQDLTGFFPQTGNGAVLLTSRNPECQHVLDIPGHKIPAFSAVDGKDFLIKQLPNIDIQNDNGDAFALELSAYLGGSPLAIKQMGGFLRETGCTIKDLLTSLKDKTQEKQLLEDTSGLAQLGYDHNLATAWKFSLTALEPRTMSVLLFFSFMDPDKIPHHIIKSLQDSCQMWPDIFPEPTTAINLYQSIRTLTRYGLIEKLGHGNDFAIHRVVQATALHFNTAISREAVFNAIIGVFQAGHPQSRTTSDTLFNHWNLCAIYAPHVLRLQNAIQEWQLDPKAPGDAWCLFVNSARYLLETGSMAKSLGLINDTEQYCDSGTRDGEIQKSVLQMNRGTIFLQHQQLAEARKCYEQAFEVRRKHLGLLDVNTVAAQNNLALTLLNERRWKDLIAFNEVRRDSIPALTHIPARLRSSIYEFLALAYREVGQISKAWDAMDKSAEILDGQIAAYSQLNGYQHFNRGNLLLAEGKFQQALSEHLIGFDIRKAVLGDHVQTAASCYRSADIMANLGRLDDAVILLQESKRMYGNLGLIGNFGKGGQARATWRLSTVFKEQGYMQKAIETHNEARRELEALGPPLRTTLSENDFNCLLNFADA